MLVDTGKIITMTEANQNFSKVAKEVDKDGSVVIFKNNRPKYLVVDIEKELEEEKESKKEMPNAVASRLIEKYKKAFGNFFS